MLKPINYKLIAHPLNWITIILMLVIAGAIGHTLLSYLGHEPSTQATKNAANPGGLVTDVGPDDGYGIQPQGSQDVAVTY